MTVRNQDIKIYRGNSAKMFVALTQSDGSAFDPTLNVDIRWAMAKSSSSLPLVSKNLTGGITKVTGGVDIVIDEIDSDFAPGVYYHELKVWDTGIDEDTAMTGAFIIRPAIKIDVADKVTGVLVSHAPTVTH